MDDLAWAGFPAHVHSQASASADQTSRRGETSGRKPRGCCAGIEPHPRTTCTVGRRSRSRGQRFSGVAAQLHRARRAPERIGRSLPGRLERNRIHESRNRGRSRKTAPAAGRSPRYLSLSTLGTELAHSYFPRNRAESSRSSRDAAVRLAEHSRQGKSTERGWAGAPDCKSRSSLRSSLHLASAARANPPQIGGCHGRRTPRIAAKTAPGTPILPELGASRVVLARRLDL